MSNPLSSIELIAAFEAVIVKGSLSAAARQLGRSQPTVRRQIETLERDLGVTLFTRSGNSLLPTTLAVGLLPQARNVISGIHAFTRAATHDANKVAGSVRVTCSRVFAMFLMPDIIAKVTSAHPGICIELAPEDTVVNLLQQEADIAIRFKAPDQNAIIAKKLSPRQLGLFAASDFQNTVPDKAAIADHLAATPFIWEDRDDVLANGARQLGFVQPSNIVLRTDDQTVQISCIQARVGAGFCQLQIAHKLGLKRMAPDWQFAAPVWVAMHEDLSKVSRIRIVFDAIVDAFTNKRQ